MRVRRDDGEQHVESNYGPETSGIRLTSDKSGFAAMANHQGHVHPGLGFDITDRGNWPTNAESRNPERPALASPSTYARCDLDRPQWKRANAHFSLGSFPRSDDIGSPKGNLAQDDTRNFEEHSGEKPASRGCTAPNAPSTLRRDRGVAYQELATDPRLSNKSGDGGPEPVSTPSLVGADRPSHHANRPEIEGGVRDIQRGGEETTVRSITAEITRTGTEIDATGTGGKPDYESGRGSGLRKLLGSWGKKSNPERSSASPDIKSVMKLLPALPQMPQEDLGFRISILNFSEEKQITTAQQMFEEKKARREQRRSLKESGDYLGVQGANPRTGYWDVSSGSEPSQMSEETKRKLDEEAREVAERKRRYEEAEMKHRIELERVQSMREKKKNMEKKMKQRRRGKWQLSENGWSSVAEPELSPIIQSVVGTPIAGEPPR